MFNAPPKTKDKREEENSLPDSSPTDSRSDEKIIVNEQRSNKAVNVPSQTAAHTSEGNSNDEEILD